MKLVKEDILLSAHDLVGHLNCKHLTQLDIEVAKGTRAKPEHWDPLLDILRERGFRHEKAFLDHLQKEGFQAVLIDGVDITEGQQAVALHHRRTECACVLLCGTVFNAQ
jgi:uncharacterized protein